VLAGLCWVFLARLAGDFVAPYALTLPLMAPPLTVAALRLPRRAGAITLALVALLYDAGTGLPFGASATVALPLHALLYAARQRLAADSGLLLALVAAALTPVMHFGVAAVIGRVSGRGMTDDLFGFASEIVAGCVLAGIATPWLAGLTNAMLRAFGIGRETEVYG